MAFYTLTRIDDQIEEEVIETPVLINTNLGVFAYLYDDHAIIQTINASFKVKEVNKVKSFMS